MMNDLSPSISNRRRFPIIWIIPLTALLIGLYMVIHTFMTEGPTITLNFATAEGLIKGKTKVRMLNVDIGVVENVVLKQDMSGVTTTIKLDRQARPLLREDTRFWVVRARISTKGISGLETLLGGSYIEMAPGDGQRGKRAFVGLEEPPVTPADAPGLRLRLHSDHAGSISTGDLVLYRGYRVGRIESTKFDTHQREVNFEVFIDAPFHELVDSSTRFWDTSGVSFKASAEGIEVTTGSLTTILQGGVAFGNPSGLPPGIPVENDREFQLYKSQDEILKNPYHYGTYFVVSFQQSLRGLLAGAPVEYRGIKVGRVERILLKEAMEHGMGGTGSAIPVLIYLEPGLLALHDNPESVTTLREAIGTGVTQGLRATLQTGNLLTGQQLINLDFFPEEKPAELGTFGEYRVIPTIETGVARLEEQVNSFLQTLNNLPLETTVTGVNTVITNADKAVISLTTTINSLNSLLDNEDSKALPNELVKTLIELRNTLNGLSSESSIYQNLDSSLDTLESTLDSLDALLRKLSVQPNTLLFPTKPEPDLIPEAGTK
ncbi:MAG: intermembrane transport protein PqiB [Pseudomonadales bacterium]|nr:intermembrane transport protein PqiB [Pseudomonadales bacterium]